MAVNFQVDDSNAIRDMCKKVMKSRKNLRILTKLRFLFIWRLGDPEYDKLDTPIIIIARKLPTRERDIYEKDVELKCHLGAWQKMSDKQRFRTVFRALLSIYLELDESMYTKADEDGRLVFRIIPPDVLIRVFKEELELFGLPDDSKNSLEVIERYRSEKREGVLL